jgi:hypothetical protein
MCLKSHFGLQYRISGQQLSSRAGMRARGMEKSNVTKAGPCSFADTVLRD